MMSPFTIFAFLLLAVATMFALANPDRVMVRFLVWQIETTVAWAVVGGAVFGGLLVSISHAFGQRRLRAHIRDLETRARAAQGPTPPTSA